MMTRRLKPHSLMLLCLLGLFSHTACKDREEEGETLQVRAAPPGVLRRDLSDAMHEPSGLAFDGTFLYTVTDRTPGIVYKMSTNGEVLSNVKLRNGGFEGLVNVGPEFFLVQETGNAIFVYDHDFNLK